MYYLLFSLFFLTLTGSVQAVPAKKQQKSICACKKKHGKTSRNSKHCFCKKAAAVPKLSKKAAALSAKKVSEEKPCLPCQEAAKKQKPNIVSGRILLPHPGDYTPIEGKSDTYTYSIQRTELGVIEMTITFLNYKGSPNITLGIETEVSDQEHPLIKDLKKPEWTIETVENTAHITITSGYNVSLSIPVVGSLTACDKAIYFAATEDTTQ